MVYASSPDLAWKSASHFCGTLARTAHVDLCLGEGFDGSVKKPITLVSKSRPNLFMQRC